MRFIIPVITRIAIFLLCGCAAFGASIIPDSRKVSWDRAEVGIVGGIPDSALMTVYTTVSAGATRATVQTQLENCPSNQVVELAAGSYSWSDTLNWSGVGPGVVLRGAGMGVTVITWSGFSEASIIMDRIGYQPSTFAVDANLSANATAGGFTLTLASVPAWVTVGNLIGVDELDDGTLIQGGNGFNLRTVLGEGDRDVSQINKVVSKTSTEITLESANQWAWSTAQTAQIFQPGWDPSAEPPLRRCAIEDLTLTYSFTGGTDAHPIKLGAGVDQCWFKNVEIDNMPSGRGWLTYYCYRSEWRGCDIHDSHNYAGGQGYGIDINDTSSNCLVEDNTFRNLHAGVVVRYGSGGNVVAYNVFTEGSNASAQTVSLSHHGESSFMNLYEGNYCEPKVLGDITHGSSVYNTVFRNRIMGFALGSYDTVAVSIEIRNRRWNIVGNILGDGTHNKYASHSGDQAAGTTGNIYKLGGAINVNNDYTTSDAWAYGSGLDILIHENYDTLTSTNSGIVYEPTISEHTLEDSLYLSSKPAWFGTLTYPPYTPSNGATVEAMGTNAMTLIPAGYRLVNGVDPPTFGTTKALSGTITIQGTVK